MNATDPNVTAAPQHTPQQIELDAAVQNLAKVIARVIPSTTVHYAIEETRRALRHLAPMALSVHTADVDPARYVVRQIPGASIWTVWDLWADRPADTADGVHVWNDYDRARLAAREMASSSSPAGD